MLRFRSKKPRKRTFSWLPCRTSQQNKSRYATDPERPLCSASEGAAPTRATTTVTSSSFPPEHAGNPWRRALEAKGESNNGSLPRWREAKAMEEARRSTEGSILGKEEELDEEEPLEEKEEGSLEEECSEMIASISCAHKLSHTPSEPSTITSLGRRSVNT
mmetsp:Transcript_65614/g.136665  ORF Transcript_65614/g.136665 Transcript_65614/m.136665 type:complete len:161 (-) Transcript_65614:1117-1599(-)